MKRNLHLWVYFSIAVWTAITAGAEPKKAAPADPFAPSPADEEPAEEFKEFTTAEGFEVTRPSNYLPLEKEDWPTIPPPTEFNRFFERPQIVWKLGDDYFAGFNAGEFGAGLFLADKKKKKWIRILNDPVEWIETYTFGDDTFLLVGGLAHLSSRWGTAHILKRNKEGRWKVRKVFETHQGVPRIIGISGTHDRKNSKMLVVLEFVRKINSDPLFGITFDGEVHYLGNEE